MSAATSARPAAPSRPVPTAREQQLTHQQESAKRIAKAFRVYILSRYEWLRLRAVGLGYLTPAGYVPLPLKGDETTAAIQGKTKVLQEWLKANEGQGETLVEVEVAPEPEEPTAKEPKRFAVPSKAPRIPCRACKQTIVFAPTEGGKIAPLNLDGTSHFATCPNADDFRKGPRAKATKPTAPTEEPTVPEHIRKILELATEMGLSHEKSHRTARLASINQFLMNNEREPVDGFRDIRAADLPLIEEGLRKRVLRWP